MSVIPTPTEHHLARRYADFATLAEALDYAAQGDTGCNFYTGTGELFAVLPYSELRDDAHTIAYRLYGLGLKRGDRVALVAETNPNFQRFFFACQYARARSSSGSTALTAWWRRRVHRSPPSIIN